VINLRSSNQNVPMNMAPRIMPHCVAHKAVIFTSCRAHVEGQQHVPDLPADRFRRKRMIASDHDRAHAGTLSFSHQ
jgi:hypothetical protein